ncbi:MAG: glycosyltransferase family 39 protein [Anaerolineales bacterium]|nr:glycosyltransferase family 39 protein [Anaerolineales bacterium]MCL4259619.1 glycosyltransferase family 39 protein [Anaerolineales bacterium]
MKKLFQPLLLIIFISTLIGAGMLRRGHEWGDDWAWYVLQAKSIADGSLNEFIEISAFTNYQSTSHLGPLAYPWGYPLILAPFYALNGISPMTLKIPGLLFYAGFLICLYLFAKSRLTRTESLIFVSLFAFNPMLLEFLDYILSDIPFLFFSTLTLLLVVQQNKSRIHYALIGAAIFFTTFIRATGLLLLGCFLLVDFFELLVQRKDWNVVKRIILNSFIVCAAFALLWIANILLFPGGGESYLSQYKNLTVDLVIGFIGAYFKVYGWFFGEATRWQYLYYFVLAFALLGVWIRRRNDLYLISFFGVWMLVHITYPYWQGPRYIFPLLPIFIYFAFQGMKFAIGKLSEKYQAMGQRAMYGFWTVIAIYFLVTSSVLAYDNVRTGRQINGPFDPLSMEVYQWIKNETPPTSVLIFFKPRVMRLMTERPSIYINQCDGMLKGDYLVLSKKVGANGQVPPEEIGKCSLPLDAMFNNRRFIIYKIEK